MSNEKDAVRAFCQDAMAVIAAARLMPQRYEGLTPFNDTSVNRMFEKLPTFSAAAAAMETIPHFSSHFGSKSAPHFTLQFLYNYLGRCKGAVFSVPEFDSEWQSLLDELAVPEWTCFGVCNLANFNSDDELLDFGDGISIRQRSYEKLSELLGWSHERIDRTLGKDWEEGSHGSDVLLIETKLVKTPDNISLSNDPAFFVKFVRILLALRLARPGFVRPGKVFYARPKRFRFGLRQGSSGYSKWIPATEYSLAKSEVPIIRALYDQLQAVEASGEASRSLNLALRSFSMIYERDAFRTEDRLIDAVTSIEATLRLDTELSFRSSFQVAGLLGVDDDDRLATYRDMRIFYDTRSKLVHGDALKKKHTDALANHERLIDLVRRLLRGFVHLTATSGVPGDFYSELDSSLQHAEKRAAIRMSLGL